MPLGLNPVCLGSRADTFFENDELSDDFQRTLVKYYMDKMGFESSNVGEW